MFPSGPFGMHRIQRRMHSVTCRVVDVFKLSGPQVSVIKAPSNDDQYMPSSPSMTRQIGGESNLAGNAQEYEQDGRQKKSLWHGN
jgi:hypothetical protein